MPRQTSLGWPVCAAVSLAIFAANAGQGVAQDNGVHVDPDSPAGKEYALPLDSARRAAEGQNASGGSSDAAAPLFGAGISHKASNGGSKRKTNQSGGADGSGDRSGGGSSAGGTPESGSVAAAVATSGGGMSAGLLTALIALGVLAVGLATGLGLRALRTGQPD